MIKKERITVGVIMILVFGIIFFLIQKYALAKYFSFDYYFIESAIMGAIIIILGVVLFVELTAFLYKKLDDFTKKYLSKYLYKIVDYCMEQDNKNKVKIGAAKGLFNNLRGK